jgi:hypothetical protein
MAGEAHPHPWPLSRGAGEGNAQPGNGSIGTAFRTCPPTSLKLALCSRSPTLLYRNNDSFSMLIATLYTGSYEHNAIRWIGPEEWHALCGIRKQTYPRLVTTSRTERGRGDLLPERPGGMKWHERRHQSTDRPTHQDDRSTHSYSGSAFWADQWHSPWSAWPGSSCSPVRV